MRKLLSILFLLLFAGPAFAQSEEHAHARITYITSNTAYVDAGSAHGIQTGDQLQVFREGVFIAQLEVRELSSRRSACAIVLQEGEVLVGDQVDLTAVTGEARVGLEMVEPAVVAAAAQRVPLGLHGRIGAQWLGIFDRSEAGSDLNQPALNLRLRGDNLSGSNLGVQADVRARRTTISRDGDDTSRNRNRVYRLNGSWSSGGTRVVLGRQVSQTLGVVSLFDGGSMEWKGERTGVGLLAGALPDPVALDVSGDVLEYGVYAMAQSAPDAVARWSFTGGALASYDGGDVDREFLYLQGRWSTREWSFYASQEVDLNRDWKEEAGEETFSATSSHLVMRWRPQRDWSFNVGLDTRRRVRRIRDRETPETEFDDAYRKGFWGGVRTTIAENYTVGLRAQTRRGVDNRSADSFTLELGARPRMLSGVRLGSRSTFYRNDLLDGWLQTLRASWVPADRWNLGVFGGVRGESGQEFDPMDGTDGWFGADLDYELARNWWLALSAESNVGGEEEATQVWTGIGWRF